MYDRLMNHVDYEAWARYIVDVFTHFGEDVSTVIEGGCGTGSLMKALRGMGLDAAGFDLSYGMVRRAKRKSDGCVWRGDLRAPAVRGGWDAFLCLYDTIQYLNQVEIQMWLEEVNRILNPGGLVVFDMVTESHVMKYWMDYTEQIRGHGWRLLRRSWYEKQKKRLHTEFDLKFREEGRRYTEHHQQFVYRIEALSDCWAGSDLTLLARHDGFRFKAGTEDSDRVHFILKKEAG
jgi:SAM-dependent methyltransferase